GEKERSARVHLVQAQADHLLVLRLVLGDAPAQVDVVQLDAEGEELLAQRRERHFDEMIPLGVHVPEGRGKEDTDASPGAGRHEEFPFEGTLWSAAVAAALDFSFAR